MKNVSPNNKSTIAKPTVLSEKHLRQQ